MTLRPGWLQHRFVVDELGSIEYSCFQMFWTQIAIAALLAWVENSDIEALPPSDMWDGRFDCPEQWI